MVKEIKQVGDYINIGSMFSGGNGKWFGGNVKVVLNSQDPVENVSHFTALASYSTSTLGKSIAPYTKRFELNINGTDYSRDTLIAVNFGGVGQRSDVFQVDFDIKHNSDGSWPGNIMVHAGSTWNQDDVGRFSADEELVAPSFNRSPNYAISVQHLSTLKESVFVSNWLGGNSWAKEYNPISKISVVTTKTIVPGTTGEGGLYINDKKVVDIKPYAAETPVGEDGISGIPSPDWVRIAEFAKDQHSFSVEARVTPILPDGTRLEEKRISQPYVSINPLWSLAYENKNSAPLQLLDSNKYDYPYIFQWFRLNWSPFKTKIPYYDDKIEYAILINGKESALGIEKTGETFTSKPFQFPATGKQEITLVAKNWADSNINTKQTLTFDVASYSQVTIARFDAVRSHGDQSKLNITYSATSSAVMKDGKNINTVKGQLAYRLYGDTNWTISKDDAFTLPNAAPENLSFLTNQSFDTSKSYDISIRLRDVMIPDYIATVNLTISTDTNMAVSYSYDGVGIRKVRERGGLDVHGDIYTDGHYRNNDGTYIQEYALTMPDGSVADGSKFNTSWDTNDTGWSIKSTQGANPSGDWGMLENIHVDTFKNFQIFTGFNNRRFMRLSFDSKVFKWLDWREFAFLDETDKRYLLKERHFKQLSFVVGYGVKLDLYRDGNMVTVTMSDGSTVGRSGEFNEIANEILPQGYRPRAIVSQQFTQISGDGTIYGANNRLVAKFGLTLSPEGRITQTGYFGKASCKLIGGFTYYTNDPYPATGEI